MTLYIDEDRFSALFVVVWGGQACARVCILATEASDPLELRLQLSVSRLNLAPLEEQHVLFAAASVPPTSSGDFLPGRGICVCLLTSFWLILLFHRGSWATCCQFLRWGCSSCFPQLPALRQGFAWVHSAVVLAESQERRDRRLCPNAIFTWRFRLYSWAHEAARHLCVWKRKEWTLLLFG